MSSTLSVYLSNHHDYASTWAYIAALQPAWIRIHQPTARTIHMAQQAAPDANIMLRSWDIDDHNGDRKREAYDYPIGAAHSHRNMWVELLASLFDELQDNVWAYDRSKWYVGLINEPDPSMLPQIIEYTAEWMRLAVHDKWRLGVMVPSVGNFGIPEQDPFDWSIVKPHEQAINDGGHILMVHEYWQPEGPDCVWIDAEGRERHDAGNLAWRHQHIPLDVPILVGESGANGYIYNRHSSQDDAGWQKFMDAAEYAAQVRQYIVGCDERVQGVCLYMTDYHSDQWQSFDTTPAHEALLDIKASVPTVRNGEQDKPHTVYAPIVVMDGPQVVDGDMHYGDDKPEPIRSEFGRVMDFIIKWEGEVLTTDSNGALAKYGINQAANPDVDVANLTKDKAYSIYKERYWYASDADKLAWPLNLAHMNAAVNTGVGQSMWFLERSDYSFGRYVLDHQSWYESLDMYEQYGRAWRNRMIDLIDTAVRANAGG